MLDRSQRWQPEIRQCVLKRWPSGLYCRLRNHNWLCRCHFERADLLYEEHFDGRQYEPIQWGQVIDFMIFLWLFFSYPFDSCQFLVMRFLLHDTNEFVVYRTLHSVYMLDRNDDRLFSSFNGFLFTRFYYSIDPGSSSSPYLVKACCSSLLP